MRNLLGATLISLGSWINIHRFRTQVSPQTPRSQREDSSSASIGRRRLKQKLCLFGKKSHSLNGYGTHYELRIERTEAFLFGGLSTPNKKSISLRPLRLCGENVPFIRPVSRGSSLLENGYRPYLRWKRPGVPTGTQHPL